MKKNSSRQPTFQKKSQAASIRLALGSRLLFDRASLATANEAIQNSLAQKTLPSAGIADQYIDFHFESLGDPNPLSEALTKPPVAQEISQAKIADNSRSNTLIVVDPRSSEGLSLLANSAERGHQNGFQQVANVLQAENEIKDLHGMPWIVAGKQRLGNSQLGKAASGNIGNMLADWADGLTDDAHIVFHSEPRGNQEHFLSHVNVMTDAESSCIRDVARLDINEATDPTLSAHSVVFIDASVPDLDTLLDTAPATAEIVYLNNDHDGLSQIAQYLVGQSGIDNIQLITHGKDGELQLGSSVLNTDSLLLDDVKSQLAQIGQSLTANGDIFVYGCGVAQTPKGQQFVSALAELIGADVVVSNHAPEWDGLLAPLAISVTSAPNVTGGTGVGAVAIWKDAGTVGATLVDLKATVLSGDPGAAVTFATVGDDPALTVTGGNITVRWQVFDTATAQPIYGNVNFRTPDIDGVSGVNLAVPSVEAEALAPKLPNLTSYTVSHITNLSVNPVNGALLVRETEAQNSEPTCLVDVDWKNVAVWDVSYFTTVAAGTVEFVHDGDGDLVFVNPTSTLLLGLDLGVNNSGASGIGYQTNYIKNAAPVAIVDTANLNIVQATSLGTSIDSASIVLTNAKLGDALLLGTLPANITAHVDTSVFGKIAVTLVGSDTLANYKAALKAITYVNTTEAPDISNRNIEISVFNQTFGTTSATAISTVKIVAVEDSPSFFANDVVGNEDTEIPLSLEGSNLDGFVASVMVQALPNINQGVLYLPDGSTPVEINTPLTPEEAASLVFQPVHNFNGQVIVPFITTDDAGNVSDVIQVKITVTPIDASVIVTEDPPVLQNFMDYATNPDGNALTILAATMDTNGDGKPDPLVLGVATPIINKVGMPVGYITVKRNGSMNFEPAPNYNGPVPVLTYTVVDPSGATDTGTLDFGRVVPVNDAPMATDASVMVPEATLALRNPMDYAADPNGNALTILAATMDTNGDGKPDPLVLGVATPIINKVGIAVGDITVNRNGSMSFEPAPNYNGSVPILTYTVVDPSGVTDTGTFDFSHAVPVNDAPVVIDTAGVVTQDTPVAQNLLGYTIDSAIVPVNEEPLVKPQINPEVADDVVYISDTGIPIIANILANDELVGQDKAPQVDFYFGFASKDLPLNYGPLWENGWFKPVDLSMKNDLHLIGVLKNQLVVEKKPFSFGIPSGTFKHDNPTEKLEYRATRIDGSPLPNWLKFYRRTQVFYGVPPKGALSVDVLVTVNDSVDKEVSAAFKVAIHRYRLWTINKSLQWF